MIRLYKIYPIFISLLCLFLLTSCEEKKIENKVEISTNIHVLGKLINLTNTDAMTVTWFTKKRSENDWYLLAKVVLKEETKNLFFNRLRRNKNMLDSRYILTKEEMKIFGIENNFVFRYKADEYFKEPLIHGALAIYNNNVFIYLYTM